MSLVKWREWGDEAFAEAREQDKPVLLDIGAVWCHWCHVMDDGIPGDPVHTGTYSNPEIAAMIAEHFIPIKVDNDRRPDINTRYNQGGWPTTVFLTPDGDMLYGETYVEPRRMLGLLSYVSDYFRDNKKDIAEGVADHRKLLAAQPPVSIAGVAVPAAAPDAVAKAIKSNFDAAYAGFGTQPKFPHPDALMFAVDQWRRTSDDSMKEIATRTLLAMAGGGMYDSFAGGFFRYSTTRNWSIPHYEKMLHDNARLSMACLLAGAAFDDDDLTAVALNVHSWLMTVMRGETGCFAGSQDADKEEHYYGLPLDERAKLPTPYIDWTVYVDWNAQMVSSLALRAKLTAAAEPTRIAEEAYRFLAGSVYPRHYWSDGKPGGETNQLIDLTALINAAIDLHEVTGGRAYLGDAAKYADVILAELHDEAEGGFFDIPRTPGAVGALARPRVEIGPSSEAASAMLRLAPFTGDARLVTAAEGAIARFADSFQHYSFHAASYAAAVASALAKRTHVVIVGDPATPEASALRRAVWSARPAGVSVESRTAAEAGEYPPGESGAPVAYVCVGTTCSAPVMASGELAGLLGAASRAA